MLSELYIENIAVIEKADVNFHRGLNVFSGETGAGKSILINSINSVIGKRTSKDIIRNGADSALVLACFSDFDRSVRDTLAELEVETDDEGCLILERKLSRSGRTVCRINARPSTSTQIKAVGLRVIDIHGQNDNLDLLSNDTQLKYIDALSDNESQLSEYREHFKKAITIRREIKRLSVDEDEISRKRDLLNYQINEIDSVGLVSGEYEKLKEKKEAFENAEKIAKILSYAEEIINGNNDSEGLNSQLDQIIALSQKLALDFRSAEALSTRISSACYELKDCLSELSSFENATYFDAEELEATEERLDVIYKLKDKYGKTIDDIIAFSNSCKNELEQLDFSGEKKEKLSTEYKKELAILKELAFKISEKRKKTAEIFAKRVKAELAFLNMPNTEFCVNIEKTALSISGGDSVSFMLATNLGDDLKPLEKLVSGGELSRIMLAIKSVIANKEHIPTLIFDEIDSGISGQAAQKVGRKLKELSKYCQVICITHLAQIASFADRHFLIEKNVENNKTYTRVKELDYEGRKRELARIISGDETSVTALNSAKDMLKKSQEI